MAEPALKIATDFVRYAVADLEMRYSPKVEADLERKGQSLLDLYNMLSRCEVLSSNKLEAEGVYLSVRGETTEEVELIAKIWINTDGGFYRVEKIA